MEKIAAELVAKGLVADLKAGKTIVELYLNSFVPDRFDRNMVKCRMHLADISSTLSRPFGG